jgi:hypothetical protein
MIRFFPALILLILIFTGCQKKDEILLPDLKGTIKGSIRTYDEFSNQNNDHENVDVKLEGSIPLIYATTDSEGKYELSNIPSGTYNLIVSKEGYGEYQTQGLQIVGGKEPIYYFSIPILQKSKTIIENFSLEIADNSEIYLKGTVHHNYIIDEWGIREPSIRYFIHYFNNPSAKNYLQTGTLRFNEVSGSQLNSKILIDRTQFSFGSEIFIILYGCSSYEFGYFDILSNQYIYTSLGIGSNIASIILP